MRSVQKLEMQLADNVTDPIRFTDKNGVKYILVRSTDNKFLEGVIDELGNKLKLKKQNTWIMDNKPAAVEESLWARVQVIREKNPPESIPNNNLPEVPEELESEPDVEERRIATVLEETKLQEIKIEKDKESSEILPDPLLDYTEEEQAADARAAAEKRDISNIKLNIRRDELFAKNENIPPSTDLMDIRYQTYRALQNRNVTLYEITRIKFLWDEHLEPWIEMIDIKRQVKDKVSTIRKIIGRQNREVQLRFNRLFKRNNIIKRSEGLQDYNGNYPQVNEGKQLLDDCLNFLQLLNDETMVEDEDIRSDTSNTPEKAYRKHVRRGGQGNEKK